MTTRPRIAVVGGSLAGLRAAEQLRANHFDGPVTVLGAEPYPPYNRPPLSKEVLADPAGAEPADLADRLRFRRRASADDVEFRTGDAVTSADLDAGTLRTEAGHRVSFDGLVVASGLRPRRLTVPGPRAGRHVLRTVDDCHGLRADLPSSAPGRVVVVGAGFIGCEVAATLRALGHDVTVVEPAGPPMARVIGAELASAVQRHHEARGVRFVIGTGLTAFAGRERVDAAVLADGRTLPADLVVEAVGSVCNTEWLAGNGLDLTDGVLTDHHLRIVGASAAVAVGDVARFPNPLFDGTPRRVEHWSIPTDTARHAAAALLAQLAGRQPELPAFAPVPSFWSDQFDLRFQCYGSPALADEVRIEEGDLEDLASGVLARYLRDGRAVGALAINLSPARQRDLREAFTGLALTS